MSTEIRRHDLGQGKRVTTLLTEGGYHFPVISHAPYVDRRNPLSFPFTSSENRNLRRHSLHRSTFTLGDSTRPDFITSTKQYFSGCKSLNPVRRPRKCPSMHKSQVELNNPSNIGEGNWNTNYSNSYVEKETIIQTKELHLRSEENKKNQTEGMKMHEIVRPTPSVSSYWSQYGERQGPAWKEHNSRVSGDKVLYERRQRVATAPLIS